MEDLETSWAEVVILEVVATLAVVSSVCMLNESITGLIHTKAGTFDSYVYVIRGSQIKFCLKLKHQKKPKMLFSFFCFVFTK